MSANTQTEDAQADERQQAQQIKQLLAAMTAVPAHPHAEFAQRQRLLLGLLADQLGCGATAATESWGQAAAKLTEQQALILIRVAMRVQSADEDADELVSECSQQPQPQPAQQ